MSARSLAISPGIYISAAVVGRRRRRAVWVGRGMRARTYAVPVGTREFFRHLKQPPHVAVNQRSACRAVPAGAQKRRVQSCTAA